MASPNEVKQLFVAQGRSVADWARKHGFPANLVYRVLRGETQCLRGTTHAIGIALGIKSPPCAERRRILPAQSSISSVDVSNQEAATGVIELNHMHPTVQTSPTRRMT